MRRFRSYKHFSIFRGLCHVLTTSDMDSLLLSKHVCSQNSTILNQIQIQRATFAALRKFSVMFRSEINLKDLLGRIHPGQTYGLIRKTYRYVVFLRFLYVVPKMKKKLLRKYSQFDSIWMNARIRTYVRSSLAIHIVHHLHQRSFKNIRFNLESSDIITIMSEGSDFMHTRSSYTYV